MVFEAFLIRQEIANLWVLTPPYCLLCWEVCLDANLTSGIEACLVFYSFGLQLMCFTFAVKCCYIFSCSVHLFETLRDLRAVVSVRDCECKLDMGCE